MKDKELKNWVRQAAEEFESPPETEARLRAQVLSMQPAPKPKAPVWRRALAGGLVGAAALVVGVCGWAFVNEHNARNTVYADGLANITVGQFGTHARVRGVSTAFLPDSELVRYTENSREGGLLCFGVTYREGETAVRLDFAVGGYEHPDLFLNEGAYRTETVAGHEVEAVHTGIGADYYVFAAGETVCYLMVRSDADGGVARALIEQLA